MSNGSQTAKIPPSFTKLELMRINWNFLFFLYLFGRENMVGQFESKITRVIWGKAIVERAMGGSKCKGQWKTVEAGHAKPVETGAKEVLRQGQLRLGQSSVINSLGGAGKVLKW